LGENETVKQIERLTGVKINKKTTRKRKKEWFNGKKKWFRFQAWDW
jgi:hypothetical protein